MQRSHQTLRATSRPQLCLLRPCLSHPAWKGHATLYSSEAVATAQARAAHAEASISPSQHFLGTGKLYFQIAVWFPSFSHTDIMLAEIFSSNLFITLPSTCFLVNCYLSRLGAEFIGSASYVASFGWVWERKRGNFNRECISMYLFSLSFATPFIAHFQLCSNTEIKVPRWNFE